MSYLKNGYWFYVPGTVHDGRDPRSVDEKLLERYEVAQSKWAKARAAKRGEARRGEAKVQYLRFHSMFVLLATAGEHRFFELERENICDARERPVRFYGYSLSYPNSE